MAKSSLEFEQPIIALEEQIRTLSEGDASTPERVQQIAELQLKLEEKRQEIYRNLTPWQRVQLARVLDRPHSLEYITHLFTDWTELHGDRHFGDDKACLAGFGRLGEQPVAIIGQQKGADLKENVFRNYGSMHPEGYRKALRVMRLAEKFERPILVFIDTAGAYPGIGAEERGQAEAIARNIMEMFTLKVPIICTVIGEGGSGGALGIGIGDRILMQENAFYSVISPEGCASILWRDVKFAPRAAEALQVTAQHLLAREIIDEIVPEPLGGAHKDREKAFELLGEALKRNVEALVRIPAEELLIMREEKYRRMGVWDEVPVG